MKVQRHTFPQGRTPRPNEGRIQSQTFVDGGQNPEKLDVYI